MFKNAYQKYLKEEREKVKKRMNRIKEHQSKKFLDSEYNPLDESCKDVLQRIFNLEKVSHKRSGMWCCCPFHNEKSPSFVSTDDYYYCKSCGAKGNVWTLIKEGYYHPKQMDNECVKVGNNK